MNVYGARYPKKEKEKMISIINRYETLRSNEEIEQNLPKNFPNIHFDNKNLTQAVNSILFSLNNYRHVIITGEEGSGITQVARWCAKIFSDEKKTKNNKNKEPYLCICSKNCNVRI